MKTEILQQLHSNTTLVKVKSNIIFYIVCFLDYSNTTLVKVKLIGIFPTYGDIFNSNTTLVKVKLGGVFLEKELRGFKYNTC